MHDTKSIINVWPTVFFFLKGSEALTVYERNSLLLTMSPQRSQDVVTVTVLACNHSDVGEVTDFVLQAAVPKVGTILKIF